MEGLESYQELNPAGSLSELATSQDSLPLE